MKTKNEVWFEQKTGALCIYTEQIIPTDLLVSRPSKTHGRVWKKATVTSRHAETKWQSGPVKSRPKHWAYSWVKIGVL